MTKSRWDKDLILYGDNYVCCVVHLHGWGERGPSFTVGSFTGRESNHAIDIEELKEHLRYVLKEWNKAYSDYSEDSMQSKRLDRLAYIQTVTSSLQPKAEGYLKELGFTNHGTFSKKKHPDSDITLWTITPEDFLKAIDWNG